MILTDNEIRHIQGAIDAHAGLDEELLRRCGHLIHLGAFDEAVRSAFVLLEERLREATKQEGMTGTNLANYAFKSDGPLAKLLATSESERQGLRELYSGAFRLYSLPFPSFKLKSAARSPTLSSPAMAVENPRITIPTRTKKRASFILSPPKLHLLIDASKVCKYPLQVNPFMRL